MRVLHVLAPTEFGGLERVVRALAAGHAASGLDVHVAAVLPAAATGAHPFVRALAGAGIPVHAVHVGGRAYLRERRAVAELCRRLRPAVAHTHGYRADVVAGTAARACGVPVVSTAHGFTGGGWRNRLYERLQTVALRAAAAVAAVSDPLARRLERGGVPAARIRVIRNAWDGRARFAAPDDARALLGVPPGVFHVGWVGRLSPEKGPDVMLDALARLGDLPLAASFVGDGPERAALEARAHRLGLSGCVRWHGARADADALFPAFDAFALSSRTEGTPMVLLEAMAAGVPVAAARVGGVPGVVGDAEALLVPPCDPAALADALRRLHGDRAGAAARTAAARRRLDSHFGPGPWLAEYEALYARVQPPSTPAR
jgi:glycosyltransferase involved in cell wall biosynthesis